MYEFENSHRLTKDGEDFFENTLGIFGRMYLGRLTPVDARKGHASDIEVVLGGGECCHGFVVGVSPSGCLNKVLELDLNVAAIVPLIHTDGRTTFLVSGQGCDGQGIRHVDFGAKIPNATVVVADEEARALLERWPFADGPSWFNVHPLDIPSIWELLASQGLDIDREKTEEAQDAYGIIGERHAVRGTYPAQLARMAEFRRLLKG